MNLEELSDKSLALIVWNTEKEDDVHVYPGKLLMDGDEHYFLNEEEGWRVSLDEEQLSRLQPVRSDLKETLLNADYALSMTMSNMPESRTSDYRETGLKWHN